MDSVDRAIVKQHLKVNFSVFALLVAALLLRFNFQISSSQIGKGEFLFAGIITFIVSLLFSLLYMGFKHGVTISKLSPSCMVIRKDEKFSFQLSITTSFLCFVFMGGIWISMFFSDSPNKLLNFVPATNSVASTGLPTLRCGSPLVMRYTELRIAENSKC